VKVYRLQAALLLLGLWLFLPSAGAHLALRSSALFGMQDTAALPGSVAGRSTRVMTKGPRLVVPNLGQWATPEVARLVLDEVTVHVERDALVFSVRVPDSLRPADSTAAVAYQWAVRQRFIGASSAVRWELEAQAVGVNHHYFLGTDRSRWRSNVPGGRVLVGKGIYPGVDLRLEVVDQQLKSTWVAARGTDLQAVSGNTKGASSASSTSASSAKGPSNTASPGAMYSLTQWAKDLMEAARTAQHTYNPGLMLEALMAQAQQALR
jgi:hypothetical protein